jgi:hypothetical protein
MAENIGFNVKVGMDVAEMQSELQKAENLLRQFQAQLKKSTNTIEISMLNTEIKSLNTQISAYGQALQKVGKPAGDATQSLINFSRIAQDAPYGMMGIANNLNPMVESFQRLAATEGGTKKALAAMAQGLMGPAGIGVAIGLLSALLSTYSKEIGNFFKGASGELDDFIKKIATLNEELFKISGKSQAKEIKAEVLIGIIGSNADIEQRQTALDALKKLYSDSDAINKLTIQSDKKAMDAALTNAKIQYEVIEKEKNNNSQLELALETKAKLTAKRQAELDKITKPRIVSSYGGVTSEFSVEQQKQSVNLKYEKDFTKVDADIAKFKAAVVFLNTELSKFEKVDNKQGKISELDRALQQLNKELLQGENLLKANKLFAVSGQDSFALNQLNAIDKAIKTIAGISGPAAEAALQKVLQQENAIYDKYLSGKPQVSRAELDTSNIFKDTSNRTTDKYTGAGEKVLDPRRTAREMQMLDKEANTIFIRGEINKEKELSKILKKQQADYESFANQIAGTVTNAFMGLFDAMEKGQSVGEALGDMFKNLVKQIAAAVIQALIFKAIMNALTGGAGGTVEAASGASDLLFAGFANGGVVSKPTLAMVGEGGESEAIMPLSKLASFLNTSFNAGAMSGSSSGNGGQFILRGSDLILATQRANSNLTLRR